MHRGLPLMMSMESVSVSSSESEFGASVSSAMLVGLHAVHSRIPGSHSGLRYLLKRLLGLRKYPRLVPG